MVKTFRNKEAVEDFSVAVTYDQIKEKDYVLSAGQYFDIKIEYVDISEEEFNAQMKADTEELTAMFKESHELEEEIQKQLASLKFVKQDRYMEKKLTENSVVKDYLTTASEGKI